MTPRVSWDRVSSESELHANDLVRMNGPGGVLYRVRVDQARDGTTRLRFKSADDADSAIHYYLGALALIRAGLIERQRVTMPRAYDIWATHEDAWSYRGTGAVPSFNDQWLRVTEPISTSGDRQTRSAEIPDHAVLVWRAGETVEAYDHES